MKKLLDIRQEDVYKKKVFLRVDVDVPIKNGQIVDDTRLKAWFKTLEYLLKNQARVVIAGHLGRPQEQVHDIRNKFSLEPIAKWIINNLQLPITNFQLSEIGDFEGWKISENTVLLENLRFYKEEEENDEKFSKKLADLAEIYVNDAFASSHRAHASIVGITEYLPHFAGFRLQEEVVVLSDILDNPKRPLAVIIGGAKIKTKLPMVEKMHHFADYVLVGGEIAENDKVLFKVQHEKITINKSSLLIADLTENKKDITVKSAENFLQICKNAASIVWNGPMGQIEDEKYQNGTNILAAGLGEILCYKVVGGGDTLGFLKQKNLLDKFSFASIGGGAMLEFLAGVKLPGIEVLVENNAKILIKP